MPKIQNTDGNMDTFQTAGRFKFSGVSVDELAAPEYTLVTIVQDISGSVYDFKDEMTKCLKTILEACQKDPRAENQMIRFVKFNQKLEEAHGFRFLSEISSDEYDVILDNLGGMTALYDGSGEAIEASTTYAKELTENGIQVNAIVFVITDGDDNSSKLGANQVKQIATTARKEESLESILTILIGITNGNEDTNDFLTHYETEGGFDKYINISDASQGKLAKLAEFVSKSISSQSQSLGSGGPSQVLTF